MAQHVIDLATFRLLYPAFADTTKFPDAYVTGVWAKGTIYLGSYDDCLLSGADLQTLLDLMAAHLLQIGVLIADGGTTPVVGQVTGATIDKVSVTMAPPPSKDGWQWWLSTTPYGAELWALLSIKAAGGWYIGGKPELRAFRKVYGTFR